MSFKDALKAGAVGAAAIYVVRKTWKNTAKNPLYTGAVTSNGKGVPIPKPVQLDKHGWNGMFWILPLAGAYFLTK